MRVLSNYQASSESKGKKKKSASGSKNKQNGKSKSSATDKKHSGNILLSTPFVKTYGVLLMFFAIFIAVAIFSYYFTWNTDNPDFNTDREMVGNWAGGFGAIMAAFFVNCIFGVSSIGFAFLFFLYGVRMTFDKTLMPLLKTSVTVILSMAWLSMLMGLFSHGKFGFIAGNFGQLITGFFVDKTGFFITFVILLALLLILLILCYNLSTDSFLSFCSKFNFLKNKKKSEKISETNSEEELTNEDVGTNRDLRELPELYITGRNTLRDEYSNNVIHFESEHTEENVAVQPNSEDEVPLDIITSNEMTPMPDDAIPETDEPLPEDAEEQTISSSPTSESVMDMEDYDPRKDLSQYKFPTPELLYDHASVAIDEQAKMKDLRANKEKIEKTLKNFGIPIQRIFATVGPTVTLYEIVPAEGVRISKIKNLEDDIALNLAALGIRIIAPIPGKGTIGIEVPNSVPQIVPMKDIIVSEKFQNNKYELPIGLGKTISNESFVVDLAKMPHLLMAGATGQGKSVGLNAIIASLLYKKHPSELKFVLVDPKKVEFTLYSIIENHYLATLPQEEEPIITDTKKVVNTLNSLCAEMDDRYNLLKYAKVRNIKEYNAKFCSRMLSPANGHRFLPYIVLIIDEFGDLIMSAGRSIETPITRLAQLARAIGIHIVIATQRPSVNIITGLIKANFPSRIAFRVSSKIDSRTILDCGGADQLIGKGDMLLSTGSDMVRLQCAFIDTPEVEELTKYIADQQGYPEPFFLPEYSEDEDGTTNTDPVDSDSIDACFMDAATLIVQTQQGSTSMIQRRMKLGYNRAGRIMDQMEEFKIVGPANGSKVRQVNVKSTEELRVIFQNMGLI